MATKKKRTITPSSGGGDDDLPGSDHSVSGSSDDERSEEEMDAEVQVDFEARTPSDCDFDGIKRLLQQVFLKAHVNTSELTDILLRQNYVCSVIKQTEMPEDEEDDDDDETFGVTSVVNITSKSEVECIKQIRALLLHHSRENSTEIHEKFKRILEDTSKSVGFVISERFVNIPPQIAVPLYSSLSKDIEEASKQHSHFNFAYYLIICKVYKLAEKNSKKQSSPSEGPIYANPEEELFEEEAEVLFDYSVIGESDTALGGQWRDDDPEMKPYRRVMVIPAVRWPALLDKVKMELAY